MMRLWMIIFSILSVLPSSLPGSEMTASSELKVAESDIIALGRIVEIQLGAIRDMGGYRGHRQEMLIRFEIERFLLGEAPAEIVIQAYSVFYFEDGAFHDCSTGFSAKGVEKNEKYLAYLILRDGEYHLASDSNQFMEHVDPEKNRMRANGQTWFYVDLHEKLSRIAELAKEKSAKPVLAANAVAQTGDDPADMQKCIEQIRAWRMSEMAKGTIGMIAGIRVGGGSINYTKDPSSGAYWNSYTGNRCSLPSSNPLEAEREREQYQFKLENEIMNLKALADFDGSGFISSEEASRFRVIVEFGLKAAHVIAEEGDSMQAVCLGLQNELKGTDATVLKEKIEEYEKLRVEADRRGITGFPAVTLDAD